MSEANTLTIQLSGDDSLRLTAEAKRRQLDADTLAQMLLHESLTKLSPLSPTDIESVEKLYTFQGKTEVLQFLEKYPFLVPLVLEAHQHIRHHFPDSALYLQHITDPEYDHPQLAVYIDRPKELNAEEAIDALERIDDEWWLDAETRSQDKMFIGFY